MTGPPPVATFDLVDSVVGARPAMIDAIPIVDELQEAITKKMGRKRRLTVRALLVGLLLTTVHDQTAVMRRVYETLQERVLFIRARPPERRRHRPGATDPPGKSSAPGTQYYCGEGGGVSP